jgi:GNAT superfamily N-acetyltransferase
MQDRPIRYRDTRDVPRDAVLALYRASGWSAAERPEALHRALTHSDALVSAWDGGRLVGLGNAISDGSLVVYYPHLLVLPDYRGRGVGAGIMRRLLEKYAGFHQQVLIADGRAIDFYARLGFEPAGRTRSMWIFRGGGEH